MIDLINLILFITNLSLIIHTHLICTFLNKLRYFILNIIIFSLSFLFYLYLTKIYLDEKDEFINFYFSFNICYLIIYSLLFILQIKYLYSYE